MLLKLKAVGESWRRLLEYVKNMNSIQQDECCFDLHKKILSYLGVWSTAGYEGNWIVRIIRYATPRVTFLFCLSYAIIIFPMGIFYKYRHDLLIVLEEIIVEIAALLSVFVLFWMLWWSDGIRRLVLDMEQMFNRSMQGEEWERQLMTSTLQKSKLMTITLMTPVLSIGTLYFWGLLPYLLTIRKLHFSGWYPYNETVSPNFEFTLISFASFFHISSVVVGYVFMMIWSILIQTAAQFRALRHTLLNIKQIAVDRVNLRLMFRHDTVKDIQEVAAKWRRVFQKLNARNREKEDVQHVTRSEVGGLGMSDTASKEEVDKEMEIILNECVQRHVELISYVTTLEKELQWSFMVQIASTLFPTGVASLYTTLIHHLDLKLFVFFNALLAFLLQLYVVCYLCDDITEESSLVKDAIFGCDWLEASESLKQSMRIMTSRANLPIVIKAGGFVPMSAQTFFGVTKLAYTYYMSLCTAIKKHRH